MPAALAFACLFLFSCAHKTSGVHRLAVLPANVLVTDTDSGWMKVGVPLVLQQDLITSRDITPSLAPDESAIPQIGADQLLRTKVESRQGKIHVEATVLDVATQKTISVTEVEANSAADLLPALNTLAKRLDPLAADFSTKNQAALVSFATAAASPSIQRRVQLLSQALTTDPGFGLGYIVLLEIVASGGEANTKPLLEQARKNSASFTPFDRAKFDLVAARFSHANLATQRAAADAVLKLAPNDLDSYAIIGGIDFLEGNSKAGEESFNRALELSPKNASLENQLAQGLIQNKRFADAEKILAALDKNPAVAPELATCILLQGDATRAGVVAEKYFSSLKNPELQVILRASWLAISGQRVKAIEMLETAKLSNNAIKGVALSEACVWRLVQKDQAGAKKTAAMARAADNRPNSFAGVATLLADGDAAPEEWRKKVNASPLSDQIKQPLFAYGFYLNGHYAEAAQEWKGILDRSGGSDLRARAMLAASLARAGKADEARKIPVQPFVMEFADLYGAVSFDEMRRDLGLLGK